jgi:DNA-binding protein HU-beta
MTKADLVLVVARAAGGSKAAAERAVNAFLAAVVDALRRGRRVTVSGFGTFLVARRAPRDGRDPRTGRLIRIPPSRVPRFRPSRALRAKLR